MAVRAHAHRGGRVLVSGPAQTRGRVLATGERRAGYGGRRCARAGRRRCARSTTGPLHLSSTHGTALGQGTRAREAVGAKRRRTLGPAAGPPVLSRRMRYEGHHRKESVPRRYAVHRAVLKRGGRGFGTPTETNVHGEALCFMGKTWERHKTTEIVLNIEQWLAAVGGWRWRLVLVGGWRLAVGVGGWWSLRAVLEGCPSQKHRNQLGLLRTAPVAQPAPVGTTAPTASLLRVRHQLAAHSD